MKSISQLNNETKQAIYDLSKEQKEELIRIKANEIHNAVFNGTPADVTMKCNSFDELVDVMEVDETECNRNGFKYDNLLEYIIKTVMDKHNYNDLAYRLEIYSLIAPNIYLASYLLHDLINDITNVYYSQRVKDSVYGQGLYDNWLENIRSKSHKIESILKLLNGVETVDPLHDYENILEIKEVLDETFKTLDDVIYKFNNLKPDGFQFLKDRMMDTPNMDDLYYFKHQYLDIMNGTITFDEDSYNNEFAIKGE